MVSIKLVSSHICAAFACSFEYFQVVRGNTFLARMWESEAWGRKLAPFAV